MKRVFGIALLLVSAFVLAQDGMMSMTPPKEVAKLDFMTGRWSGTFTSHMGPAEEAVKVTMVGKRSVSGRYIQCDYTMDSKSMPNMSGLQLATYDESTKDYLAYWFDSTAAGAMEMHGNFMGNTLRFISKPTPMPGMDQPVVMRTWYTKVSATKVEFLLEMKQGDAWVPVMNGPMTKKGK